MVFYLFGPSPDSWAVGNDVFAHSQNLPQQINDVWNNLREICQDGIRVGSMISWIASSPTGDYAIKTQGGEILSNRSDLMAAATPYHEVQSISFALSGAWVVIFNDGSVQLSQPLNFPQTFYSLVSRFLDTNNPRRQKSFLKAIFFGAGDSCIIQTDREVLSENVSEPVRGKLLQFIGGDIRETGVSLGENTVLCPWDPNFCFLEAKRRHGPLDYFYEIPPQQASVELVLAIVAGQMPPPHLVSQFTSSTPYMMGGQSGLPPSGFLSERPPVQQPPMSTSTNPFASPGPRHPAGDIGQIPAEARERYELQYRETAGERPSINGAEASMLLMTSGLSREELGKIWAESDLDQDGRFDLTEFVNAMWKVEKLAQAQRPGQSYPPASQPGHPYEQGLPQQQPLYPSGPTYGGAGVSGGSYPGQGQYQPYNPNPYT